jgi:quercetin dioxygenase-like cupin family protein
MSRAVTIVDINDIEAVEENIGRSGTIIAKTLPTPTGLPGVDMDFTWVSFSKGYGTPRHRHTFDQIRYMLAGKFQSAQGDIETDQCGYYPEGVHYGPQMQDEECVVLFLQFPGPSGIRYVTHHDLDAARRRLIAEGGSFKDGVYTRILPDGRKFNQDSHAACFEAVTGQKIEFPEGRNPAPIYMRPEAERWVPDRRLPGIERKHLGTFGERRTGMGLLRLAPGASLPAHRQEDAEILYLVDGTIGYAGRTWTGGKTQQAGTHMFVPAGADVQEISSETGGTFFSISLPMIADLEAELRMGTASRASAAA